MKPGWTKIPLPEPVKIEAGKTYEYGFDDDGVPYVRETAGGAGQVLNLGRCCTVTDLLVFEQSPRYGVRYGPAE